MRQNNHSLVTLACLLGASTLLPMCGSDSSSRKPHDTDDRDASGTDSGYEGTGGSRGSGGSKQNGDDSGIGPDASASGGSGGGEPDASADGGPSGELDGGPSDLDATTDQRAPAAWHLWVMEASTKQLFGYAPDQLTTTNGDAPDIAIKLPDNLTSLHFDALGNLWGASLDTTVVKYAAGDLKKSGTIAPVGKFTENGLGNVTYVAFDKSGNLWTCGYNGHGLYRYDAATLTTLTPTSQVLTPPFKLTTTGPSQLVFDAAGNVYTTFYPGGGYANPGRFNASQLVGTGSVSDPPPLAMNPGIGFYADTVISPSGELVFASTDIYRYTTLQMAQVGSGITSPPALDLKITGFSPTHEAFAPDGNLWVTADTDKFMFIGPTDLAKTGTVTVTPAITMRAPVSVAAARFGSIVAH